MKKKIIIGLILTMGLGLIGCGTPAPNKVETTAPTETVQPESEATKEAPKSPADEVVEDPDAPKSPAEDKSLQTATNVDGSDAIEILDDSVGAPNEKTAIQADSAPPISK